MSARRPEHIAPPEIFYDVDEASKYTQNSRIMAIQESMTNRALELLNFEDESPRLILDLGCGSGLSSICIEEHGHKWIGVDISEAMISVAKEKKSEGELSDLEILQSDMGDGLPFRPGTFDGAISISALQWLCNADKKSHNPAKRLLKLFSSLYSCLTREGRAVFQFYPENAQQVELINQQALKAGFMGGNVIDYPEGKNKKFFLVLSCSTFKIPKALEEKDDADEKSSIRNEKRAKRRGVRKVGYKSREYILKKKETQRRRGQETRRDTKYTGRKRSGRL